MKTLFILSAAVLMLSACSDDRELGNPTPETKANAIGFEVLKKNVLVRSGSGTGLEETNHYNFGVFAYKNSDATNNIMENYLVGYHGTDKGYDYSPNVAGWYYEGLGSSQYNYTGDNYYKSSDNFYMSNVGTQYLRYWDNSSESTSFYAYAPYINGGTSVTFNNNTKELTLPAGSVTDGKDDRSKYEFMYAQTTVAKANYSNRVQLSFKRLSAKVNIGFYETISGYTVEILNLKDNEYSGVCAAPAKLENTTYSYGDLYKSSKVVINFSDLSNVGITWSEPAKYNQSSKDHISFAIPSGKISEDSSNPTKSSTDYYALPKNASTGGLTFHVTFKLTSTTNETIIVHDAKVFVPASYCNWDSNHAYTYIFKITTATTGSTDSADTNNIDPSSPNATDEKALYPIVFEKCTVEDWVVENNQEENIN